MLRGPRAGIYRTWFVLFRSSCILFWSTDWAGQFLLSILSSISSLRVSTEPIAGPTPRHYTALLCPTLSYSVLPHTRTILHGEARCPAKLSGATLARRMQGGREERTERTGQEHNRHQGALSNSQLIKHHKSRTKQRDQTVRSVRENQPENK